MGCVSQQFPIAERRRFRSDSNLQLKDDIRVAIPTLVGAVPLGALYA